MQAIADNAAIRCPEPILIIRDKKGDLAVYVFPRRENPITLRRLNEILGV